MEIKKTNKPSAYDLGAFTVGDFIEIEGVLCVYLNSEQGYHQIKNLVTNAVECLDFKCRCNKVIVNKIDYSLD